MSEPRSEEPIESSRSEGPDAEGMGPHPSGPQFAPWYADAGAADPGAAEEPPAPGRVRPPSPPLRRPTDRLPAVLTLFAVAAVALVVAVGSLLAYRGDTRPTARPAVTMPSPAVTTSTDQIDFTTADGSGVLRISDHTWSDDFALAPETGSYLTVEVELTCLTGFVDDSPYQFQAFDRTGQLFDIAETDNTPGSLGIGTLTAGESIRGTVGFDISRGEVTLLLSDDESRSVTALKIPD